MMTNYKSWLLTAIFVLFGMLGAQAQDLCMNLVLQHVESDYVPADECNYYRHFFTLENLTSEQGMNIYSLQAGDDHFILYRYPTQYDEDDAEPIPVAELEFTLVDEGVEYEITYLNQEPLAGYDLDLVTEGTLAVEDYFVNLDGIVLVDQLSASLTKEDYINIFWKYSYYLELAESDMSSNVVEVNVDMSYFHNLGFYSWYEIDDDIDAKLTAGVKNAEIDFYRIDETAMPVTAYSLLRGDNTYPNVEISHLTALDCGDFVDFVEQSNFLPEYYGKQEHNFTLTRNDSSKLVIGQYGDFMTYVPVVWTNGEDRVKQDGDNSYGSCIAKTGVARLDVLMQGTSTDPGSEDSWLDENGQMCVFFNPIFYVSATMPDYATWEYEPVLYRIWRKCNNIRNCLYNEETGQLVNDVESPREEFELIEQYYCYEDETEVAFGDMESYRYEFGATSASADGGISFLIRMYYQTNAMIPLKGDFPSWMPMYYVVEKEIFWAGQDTGVNELNAGNETGKTYYNLQGIASDTPYDGLNIVVTRYSDGTTKTTKVMR